MPRGDADDPDCERIGLRRNLPKLFGTASNQKICRQGRRFRRRRGRRNGGGAIFRGTRSIDRRRVERRCRASCERIGLRRNLPKLFGTASNQKICRQGRRFRRRRGRRNGGGAIFRGTRSIDRRRVERRCRASARFFRLRGGVPLPAHVPAIRAEAERLVGLPRFPRCRPADGFLV